VILSNIDIKKAIEEKRIIVEPLPEDTQYNSSALDLRLNDEFKEYNQSLVKQRGVELIIDYSEFIYGKFAQAYLKDIPKETNGTIIIKPGVFILARTLEKVTLPMEHQIAARVEGRSSGARLGLTVHLSCPTIHAGFSGSIALEIINYGPVRVRLDPKKDRICQLIFEQLLSKPEGGEAILSQFQGQKSVVGVPPHSKKT